MRTHIKFAQLAKLSGDDQRKALVEAINFELQKPQMLMDLLQGKGHMLANAFKAMAPQTAFVLGGERIKGFLAQKYATPSTNPYLADVSNEMESWFHTNMPELDNAWTALFDLVDLRNSTHSHFDVLNTNAGITFEAISSGGEVKVRREISEGKTTCSMVTYGAGLGILDEWLADQVWWKVEEAVSEFIAQYHDKQAAVHYALFTGQSTGIDQSFSTDDTQTFNAAAADILRDVRSSGYATGTNPGFYILTSPEKAGRIMRLLMAQQGSPIVEMQSAKEPLAFTVRGVIASTHVTAADTGYYLILPGRKIKRGLKQDLQIESARDIYKRATDWVGTSRFNAIVGDTAQIKRVKFS